MYTYHPQLPLGMSNPLLRSAVHLDKSRIKQAIEETMEKEMKKLNIPTNRHDEKVHRNAIRTQRHDALEIAKKALGQLEQRLQNVGGGVGDDGQGLRDAKAKMEKAMADLQKCEGREANNRETIKELAELAIGRDDTAFERRVRQIRAVPGGDLEDYVTMMESIRESLKKCKTDLQAARAGTGASGQKISSLENQVANLKRAATEAARAAAEKDAEIEGLNGTIGDLGVQLTEAREQLNEIAALIPTDADDVEHLVRKLEACKASLKELKKSQQSHGAAAGTDALQAQIRRLREEVADLKKQIQALIEDHSKEMEQLKGEHDANIKRLQGELDEAKTQVEELVTKNPDGLEVGSVVSDLKKCNAELELLRGETPDPAVLADLKQKVTDLKAQIESLKTEKESLNKRVAQLGQNLETAQQRLGDLPDGENVSTLRDEITAHIAENKSLLEQVASGKGDCKELRDQHDKLVQKIAELDNKIKELEAKQLGNDLPADYHDERVIKMFSNAMIPTNVQGRYAFGPTQGNIETQMSKVFARNSAGTTPIPANELYKILSLGQEPQTSTTIDHRRSYHKKYFGKKGGRPVYMRDTQGIWTPVNLSETNAFRAFTAVRGYIIEEKPATPGYKVLDHNSNVRLFYLIAGWFGIEVAGFDFLDEVPSKGRFSTYMLRKSTQDGSSFDLGALFMWL